MMTESELNEILLDEFPNSQKRLTGTPPGGTAWTPAASSPTRTCSCRASVKRFESVTTSFSRRACRFVEHLLTMGDPYAENVASVGILEGVKSTEDAKTVRLHLGPRSLDVFDDPTL